MDKDKIINEILTEWAMRSPDGLSGGYDTPENLSVLEEVMLMKHGMSGLEFDLLVETINEYKTIDPKFFVKNEKGEYVIGGKYKHHKYPPGVKLKDILKKKKKILTWAKYKELQKTRQISDEERAKRIKEDRYTDFAAANGKRAGNTGARWIQSAVEKTGKEGKNFYDAYDTLTMEEAIAAYSNKQYDNVIAAIEGTGKEKKGLGRGELFFVWLMAGYKSGGTREVDLVFGSVEKDIELKELTGTSKKDVVGISAPTLKGYYNTTFRLGIDELATEIRKNGNKGIHIDDPNSYEFEKNPCLATFLIYVLQKYPGPEGGDRQKMLRSLVNFCSLLRTTEMPTNLFNALAEVGQKLAGGAGSKPDQIQIPDAQTATASVTVGGQKQEFAVDAADAKQELDAIIKNKKSTLDLDIKSSIEKKTIKDYEGEAKSLTYFKQKYTIDKISKELRSLLKSKYSGLIVIDKRTGNQARFVKADAEFTFINLGLNKIHFVLPGEDIPDDDTKD